jgi:hypothetical protein
LTRLERAVTWGTLLAVWAFLLSYFPPSLLLLDTMTAGGDTPSFHHPIEHLRNVLLPAGLPQGWDPGNFAGYAPFQFYFLPPSLLIVALSWILPFNVAFKLVTVVGVFALPLTTVLALRAMRYPFPIPALGAAATLLFLFNEGNSMWGGNIPSTLAGEFSFSISFALSVLFLGLLHRGITEDRGSRALGVLLALIGLCHPVTFITSALAGLYFLIDARTFKRHLAFLVWMYAIAALLMSFWLLPLLARLPYATSIHWVWSFRSWSEALPALLIPAAVLALVNIVRLVVRARSTTGPGHYLLFCFLTCLVAFGNANNLGVPDIRFLPFAQFLIVLLALDLLATLVPLLYMPVLPALALAAGIMSFVQFFVTLGPVWARWNYEGIETKRGYPALQQISAALKGTFTDPRVAYEHSPSYEVFGSMRIFESLPRLTGRATLEGVLLQTAVTSPFIYYMQSQHSTQSTSIIPGYAYPPSDPARGTARLDLFNVRDFLAVSPAVKTALDGDTRWNRLTTIDPYVIYRRRDVAHGYVRVPRYQPVLIETKEWKKDFHRWFSNDAALEVPLVAAASVPAEERGRFPLTSGSPVDLPRVAMPADCAVTESVSSLSVEFTTTCPGVAHWIAISYHPNWHAAGAPRVYLASPAFMLVVPDGPKVRLEFRRAAIDWIGLLATIVGLGLCAAQARVRALLPGDLALPVSVLRRTLAVLGVVVLIVTAWNITALFGSQYVYRRAWRAFERQDYPAARREFERALAFGRGSPIAPDAEFFRAASLFRLGEFGAARQAYEDVIREHPESIWLAESLYHVGLCEERLGRRAEAAATLRRVVAEHPGSRWAELASEWLANQKP